MITSFGANIAKEDLCLHSKFNVKFIIKLEFYYHYKMSILNTHKYISSEDQKIKKKLGATLTKG